MVVFFLANLKKNSQSSLALAIRHNVLKRYFSFAELTHSNIPCWFVYEAEDMLYYMRKNLGMSDIIKQARTKLNSDKFKDFSPEKKSAGILLNIFTNADEICKSAEEKFGGILVNPYTSSDKICEAPEKRFYKSVNKELREGKPGAFWQNAARRLDTSLRILGFKTFDYLYRGERGRCLNATFPDEGHSYNVQQFWSTTLDPVVTQYFGGSDCLFYIIKDVTGVNITDVSVTDQEKEVLIPSSSKFILNLKTTNPSVIEQELENVKTRHKDLDVSEFRPKMLVILSQNGIN